MTYTIRMTGNEVRLVLRALGRYGGIKQDMDAKELALRIEQEFKRQREKQKGEKNAF